MKNYPLYETTVFENFRVLTENAANKSPDTIACVYRKHPDDAEPVEITYEQMRCDIRHMGTEELAMGLRDAHVALIGESSYFWVCSYFSLMSVSAITIPLDKEMPLVDMAATLIRAETTALFCSPAIEEKVAQLLPLVPGF